MASSGPSWTPERFRAAVSASAGRPAEPRLRNLLDLLQEAHEAYNQCSTAEVVRRRAWVLVELGREPLGDEALPVVLDELQTGHHPLLLAAACRALRRTRAPTPAYAGCLLRALQTLSRRDDVVDLDTWGGAPVSAEAGSAFAEALCTLRWMGPHARGIQSGLAPLVADPTPLADDHCLALKQVLAALPEAGDEVSPNDCCSLPLSWRRRPPQDRTATPASVRFEDQDGVAHGWSDLLVGRPSVVVFFYTRCDNEQKCSLSIAKLGRLQKWLGEAGAASSVNLVAITYDPAFDLPHRLRGYAESRGVVPGPQCHLLRATRDQQALQDHFELGVNFTGSLVNRHQIEVHLLDSEGRPGASYQRLGWDPAEVGGEVLRLAANRPKDAADGRRATAAAGAAPGLWALLLALLPKCPLCGATYLSSTGLMAIPYYPGWERFWPAILLALVINLAAMAWISRAGRNWMPLAWAAGGAALLVGPGLAGGQQAGLMGGAALTLMGAALAVARAGSSGGRRSSPDP